VKDKIINYIIIFLNIIYLLCLLFLLIFHHPSDIFKSLGLVISICSGTLILIARIQLGESFAISAKAKELVTHGLYFKIRHPIYVFGQLFLLGIVIYLERVSLFYLWFIVLLIQIARVRKEERVLEEKFGTTYKEYKKNTWF